MDRTSLLQHRIDTINELIETTRSEAEELQVTLKRLDGFAFGHKEIVSKFKDHVKKQQEELNKLAAEGKIAPAVVSFVASYILASQKFLEEADRDARKLFHTRQGELVSMASNVEKLQALVEKSQEEIQSLQREEQEKKDLEEKSLKMLSEKSEKKSEVETPKDKKKSTRKRPDQVGRIAETVERLKKIRKSRT